MQSLHAACGQGKPAGMFPYILLLFDVFAMFSYIFPVLTYGAGGMEDAAAALAAVRSSADLMAMLL